jgi:hypothetical protein
LEGVSNGHADLAKVSNGGNPVRLGEEVRNGAAKPAVEVDGIGLPAAAQWQDRPPRSEPALDEPDTAVVRLHSERGAARRH